MNNVSSLPSKGGSSIAKLTAMRTRKYFLNVDLKNISWRWQAEDRFPIFLVGQDTIPVVVKTSDSQSNSSGKETCACPPFRLDRRSRLLVWVPYIVDLDQHVEQTRGFSLSRKDRKWRNFDDGSSPILTR